jgi:hypothetical protein
LVLAIAIVLAVAACDQSPTQPHANVKSMPDRPLADYQCPYWLAYYPCTGLPTFYPLTAYDIWPDMSGWCEYGNASCVLRNGEYQEIADLTDEMLRLNVHPHPYCQAMSASMRFYLGVRDDFTVRLRFWVNTISTTHQGQNGILVGDMHFGSYDPWAGEMHIYVRDTRGMKETFRHESAHDLGNLDPPDTGSTYSGNDPWQMDAYQAAYFCR